MNYATKLREEADGKVVLAGLDVVNVYFRTREKKDLLKLLNILPIYSSIDASTLDVAAISAEIETPINDKSYSYFIDVGGDNVGAVFIQVESEIFAINIVYKAMSAELPSVVVVEAKHNFL